jgi:hypothetical protein
MRKKCDMFPEEKKILRGTDPEPPPLEVNQELLVGVFGIQH